MNDEKATECEDTEVLTPGEEAPKEREASDCEKAVKEDPNAFTACVTLESNFIAVSNFQVIMATLDDKLKAIRDEALIRVHEIKNQ